LLSPTTLLSSWAGGSVPACSARCSFHARIVCKCEVYPGLHGSNAPVELGCGLDFFLCAAKLANVRERRFLNPGPDREKVGEGPLGGLDYSARLGGMRLLTQPVA
jgi:hypothetical protein